MNRRPGCDHENPDAECRSDTIAATQLEFPWIFRLGVEVRPVPELRLELAAVYETWSVQDAARIDPQDVWIEGALGGGLEYQVGPLSIPRNMNDTISIRLGGAYTIEQVVTARLGFSYENGAFADEWLTALTMDSDKVVVSGGVGIDVSPEVSIDVNGGYLWMAPRDVTTSMVPQSNPIRPPGNTATPVFIGNGTYNAGGPFFGLGMRWRLDAGNVRGPGMEPDVEEEPEPEPTTAPAPEPEPVDETPSEGAEQPAGEGGASEGAEQPWYLRGEDG